MSELINNREHRIQTLKGIIKHLHQGRDPEEVKGDLATIVGETDATEIAAMEQELMAEGMEVEEIQSMCDLHSTVVRDILNQPMPLCQVDPGHPVDTFRRENDALKSKIFEANFALLELDRKADEDDAGPLLMQLRRAYGELMDFEKHYNRKENLLFSVLERHGVTGPSKVMWGKDDEVRELMNAVGEALQERDSQAGQWKVVSAAIIRPAFAAMEEMISKEENILLPMAMSTVTEEEWAEIWAQSPEYGWCMVEPRTGYTPPEKWQPKDPVTVPLGRDMVFPSGSLNFEQLLGIFGALPVDLTFVDAEDRVRFFSEGPERVFSRSRAVVGRKVQNCHPPKSVHMVEQILEDFRNGRQSRAEFWIELRGQFVHIDYFAVRDEKGEYLGCLEVTQDLTRLRALEGERRLLQYDS